MLNITNRFSLSKKTKKAIKKFKKKNGGTFDGESWKKIGKRVKNEISKKLLYLHGPKCVYCERLLLATGNQIDHFAHKAQYSQFTFEPINLFYSCTFCNSSDRKGQKNTVNNPLNIRYNLCDFNIVHPYLNIPDNEIFYQDVDKVFYDKPSCTGLGLATIDFFKWDDELMTIFRATELRNQRLNPISTIQEKIIISQIISYK